MSRCLSDRGVDHVLLERGLIANAWRTERWKSLRLLTPNWQSRLPGYGYEGDDPHGYRNMTEVIAFIDRYAEMISAPVEVHTAVTSVRTSGDGPSAIATDFPSSPSTVMIRRTGFTLSTMPGSHCLNSQYTRTRVLTSA